MAKLVIRAIRCVEETDEGGADDVYMAVFRGSFTLPPNIKVVGGKNTSWGDMTSGKLVTKDVVIEDNYHQGDVFVAALIEQDWGRDLEGGSLAGALGFWSQNWSKFAGASGHEACALTATLFFGGLPNDEFLGVRNIAPIYAPGGVGQLLPFYGDGGYYRARAVLRT